MVKAAARVKGREGISLVEAMIAVAIMGGIVVVLFNYQTQLTAFIRHTATSQSLGLDARRCVDIISRHLTNARAGTLEISSPGPEAPPYSRVDFVGTDQAGYAILWSSAPAPSVHVRRTPQGSAATFDSVIAVNVKSLMFYPIDFRDPAIVHFTVQLQSPYGASDPLHPEHAATALIANQAVEMVTRQ